MEKDTLDQIAKKAADEPDHKPLMFKPSDKAYNFVAKYMPEGIKKRQEMLAFTLGASTSLAVSYAIRKGLESIAGPEMTLQYTNAIKAVELGFPFVYSAAFPDKTRIVLTKHPVFTSGWAGVWVGFMAGLYVP